MSNYLITYIEPRELGRHEDLRLDEFTYGDKNQNGRTLKNKVQHGDFLFFHTTRRNKRVITSYFVVESIISVEEAKKQKLIVNKYKNPHLLQDKLEADEVIVFGNPITSCTLKRPVPLTVDILNKLDRKPNLNANQKESAAITSALRQWKELTKEDVGLLLDYIIEYQQESYLKDTYLSNDEIEQIEEIDVENFIAANPKLLGVEFELFKRQHVLSDGNRLDLLLRNSDGGLIVVEIKKGMMGKEVYQQVRGYIKKIKEDFGTEDVKGMIVGSGVMPAYEEFYENVTAEKELQVRLYGWKFSLWNYFY